MIAIIGALVAMMVPAVQASREAARRASCANNLRQVGVALLAYHDAVGVFPSGALDRKTGSKPKARQLSWCVLVLPFIEEGNVYDRFDLSKAYNSAENRAAGGTIIPVYLCPSTVTLAADRKGDTAGDVNRNGHWDPGDDLAFGDYGGNFGFSGLNRPYMNGVLVYERGIAIAQIVDGTSHTIVVSEDTGRGPAFDGQWSNGENIFDTSGPINDRSLPEYRWQDNEMWSDHPSGVNVLFCDGSVHFLFEQIDLETLASLCTRNGNEVVESSFVEAP